MNLVIMEPKRFIHKPVMVEEIVDLIVADPNGLYLDATVGLGGHTEAILRRLSPEGRILAVDLDPEALFLAAARLSEPPGRVRFAHENFRNISQLIEREKFFPLTGALFDLGVSSLQLEKGSRGFSFQNAGPLDMRLDPGSPLTAARIVNEWPAEQLSLLFKEFGEEKQASRIAGWIVSQRARKPFETTSDLSGLIESKIGRHGGIHPATRTFMALRIAVNHELENLTRGIESVLPHIKAGGRLAVVTFHSLEDRIVKNVFKSFVEHGQCDDLTPSPARPTQKEIEENPRSRSAKLRVVQKR